MTLRLALIGLLICASLSPSLFADAGSMPLETMVSLSSTIVLGRVNKVTVLASSAGYPVKIAEVSVLEVLKGDRSLKTVYYWASPGSACDVTAASEGTQSLFMFTPGTRYSDYPRSLSKILPKIKAITGNRELAKIVHLGRGQMEIKRVDGVEYVLGTKREGEVAFPKSLKMFDYPDTEYPYVGMVKVDDLLAFIKSSSR